MSRKSKGARPTPPRSRPPTEQQKQDAVVHDTLAQLLCSADTAKGMAHQCECRIEDADIDLIFAGLAREVWSARQDLAPLLDALIAEQLRHGQVMDELSLRFRSVAAAQHEHLEKTAVDPHHVRTRIFTDPDDQPLRVVRTPPADLTGPHPPGRSPTICCGH